MDVPDVPDVQDVQDVQDVPDDPDVPDVLDIPWGSHGAPLEACLDSPCQDIREALRAFPALDSHLVDHEGQAEDQTLWKTRMGLHSWLAPSR